MTHWWRAYDHAVDNAKLHRLTGDAFKAWFYLCCLASANSGALPSIADVAFKLRVSEAKARNVIATLQAARLIDDEAGILRMHDWSEYQYKSDLSTDRVKQWRKQQRNVSSNVASNESETDDETLSNSSMKRNGSVSVSSLPFSPTSLDLEEPQREQASGKFEIFWKKYPHKVGRKDAEKKFIQALKSASFETLMAALAAYCNKTDDRPWCNPATWLNQGRWDDEPATQRGGILGALDRLEDQLENGADSEAGQDAILRLQA